MLNNDTEPWGFGGLTHDDDADGNDDDADTDLHHLDDEEERERESDSNQQTGEQAEQTSKQTRALVTN